MDWYWILIIIGFVIIFLGLGLFNAKKERELKSRVNNMMQNQVTTNATIFLQDYKLLAQKRNGSISSMENSGVYVILNLTKNLYYVGQSKNVLKRVKSHLTGSGNGDVYADFKYGDNFEVTIHNCSIIDLNNIERTFISKYNASGSNGYNKNNGVR